MTETLDQYEMPMDYKKMTLEWAAAVGDGYPSERLDFIKDLISVLTEDELRRLKKMVQLTKRKVCNLKVKANTKGSVEPTAAKAEAATSSSDAANSSAKAVNISADIPWWTIYDAENTFAWDSKHVQKWTETRERQPTAGSVDIVNGKSELVYSKKVFHKTGSFDAHPIAVKISGFAGDSLDNPSFPKLEKVREEVDRIFKPTSLQEKKLVITLGGISDYKALNLQMGDYDLFDLQSHWYVEKYTEHFSKVIEPHSLKSLVKYYLPADFAQWKQHDSTEDARMTMKLFEIYKEVKIKDDAANISTRKNKTHSYNEIPVLPKERYGKKKKKCKHLS